MNVFVAESEQVRKIEAQAGCPTYELMERAGGALFSHADRIRKPGTVLIFCATGQNGGDGFVAARRFYNSGANVLVILCGDAKSIRGDAWKNYKKYVEIGGKIISLEEYECIAGGICPAVAIDCLFGIGLSRPPSGIYEKCIRIINELNCPVVACDLPSGVFADDGSVPGIAVKADVTVTFICLKPAHVLFPALDFMGEIAFENLDVKVPALQTKARLIEEGYFNENLPPKRKNSHKGDSGHALIICGSEGYTGAAYFSAVGALRAGAGLVTLCVPRCIYPVLAGKLNEAIVRPLPDDGEGKLSLNGISDIIKYLEKADVCLAGCGLSRSDEINELIAFLIKNADCPLILDADGINAVQANIDVLRERNKETLITPHAGELSRLLPSAFNSKTVIDTAEYAERSLNVSVLLKGYRTVVASGSQGCYVNSSGNPGMAKGGSGDLLAGMIAGMAAGGMRLTVAAACAAFWHGRAGDSAAERFTSIAMTPGDMISELSLVLKRIKGEEECLKDWVR